MKEYILKTSHSKAYRVFYVFLRATIGFFFKILYRIEIKGAERLPLKGKFILCSNHQSYIDPVIIGLFFPRYLYFMGKVEIFKNNLLAAIVSYFNAFPVSRGTFDRQAIRTAVRILEAEEVVGLFPEGTRATDGKIKDAQKGVALISILSKSPILPVAISGSNKIIQKPHKRLYFPKIRVSYGDTIDTVSIMNEYGTKNAPEIIVKRTMEAIKNLYNESTNNIEKLPVNNIKDI